MWFRWMRQVSRSACISATVTRVVLRKLDIEKALELSLPNYAINPESLSQLERKRILKEATDSLKRIEECRRSGTSYQRRRG